MTVLTKLETLLKNDEALNTITRGLHFDINKANDFPMGHVNITDFEITSSTTINFSFRVMVSALRETTNTPDTDKFNLDGSEDCNLDSMCDVLVRLYLDLLKLGDGFNIISASPAQPMIEERMNVVDGWFMDIVIEVDLDEAVC